MIGVNYDKDTNLINLVIDYDDEYSYPLGQGILSTLNFNLTFIDSMLIKYIKDTLSEKNSEPEFAFAFFEDLLEELAKFNPYFKSVYKDDLEKTVIGRFIRYLLTSNLFSGYSSKGLEINKEEDIIIPKLILKESPDSLMNGIQFIDNIRKLIGYYNGIIEQDVSEDFINQVHSYYEDSYIPDIVMLGMHYYEKYCFLCSKEGSFECILPSSLEVNSYNLGIVKSDVEEFTNFIFSSDIDATKAVGASHLKIIDYHKSYQRDQEVCNNFGNLTYSHYFIEDENDFEYKVESIYDLIFVEALLMAENGIKLIKCLKCNNYIIYKQPKECPYCKQDYKRKIRTNYGKNHDLWKRINLAPLKREEINKELFNKYVNKIISKIEELALANVLTEKQYKAILKTVRLNFYKYCNGKISGEFFVVLYDKLHTDSYWYFTSGDENAINRLLNL